MRRCFWVPRIWHWSLFLEVGNYPYIGKLLDWDIDGPDTDIWVMRKIHIVLSNEKVYDQQRH